MNAASRAHAPAIGERLPVCEIAITQAMIDAYAEVSGDFNPLHVDERAAAATPFGGTIAHGCIPAEPVFKAVQQWLGTDALPEDAALSLRYRAPSRPGDTIRVEGELAAVEFGPRGGIAVFLYRCINQRGEAVLDGEFRCPLHTTEGASA
jgi:3-hydroxybutyryl-CoA dehydratase